MERQRVTEKGETGRDGGREVSSVVEMGKRVKK